MFLPLAWWERECGSQSGSKRLERKATKVSELRDSYVKGGGGRLVSDGLHSGSVEQKRNGQHPLKRLWQFRTADEMKLQGSETSITAEGIRR